MAGPPLASRARHRDRWNLLRLWRHTCHEGQPHRLHGVADYLGWNWKSKAGLPIVNVPGCPVQPDNFMETVLYLLYQVAGLAPMIPLDKQPVSYTHLRAHETRHD